MFYAERNRDGLFEPKPTPVQKVVSLTDVHILRQVGERLGVGIVTLARAGESYTTINGRIGYVRKGEVFIELQKGENNNLEEYWASVRNIKSELASEVEISRNKKSLFSRFRLRR